MTYIAFSTASMLPLAGGNTAEEALSRATKGGANTPADDQFIIVAEFDGPWPIDADALPTNARIVWRGANELAQRFRSRS